MEDPAGKVALSALQRALVRTLAPGDEADSILDDLAEEGSQRAATHGRAAARRWVRWQLAHSVCPWLGRRLHDTLASVRTTGGHVQHGLWSDMRIATRRLVKAPAFTSLATLTLAIGIGAVLGVFSLAHALWLKPVPYQDPGRLVWIHARHQSSGTSGSVTTRDLAAFRESNGALAGIAGFSYGAVIARVNDEPMRVVAYRVTPDLFRVLGVQPAIGRDFTDNDAAPGSNVAVLSHRMWTSQFGRDPSIVGKSLTLGSARFEIAGVMPRGFSFPRGLESDMWIPASFDWTDTSRVVQLIGRLGPGRTLAEANAEVDVVARRQASLFPDSNAGWSAQVASAGVTTSANNRLAFQALLGIVALFLLVACANLAGLLLARNAARRAELAICLSIGATRWRLARMLLVESAMLAVAGGAAGVVLGAYASRGLAALMPPQMPGLDDVGLNTPAVVVAIGAAVFCALLIGLLPALSIRSMRPAEALAGTRTVVRSMARAQRSLVVAEIALAIVLIVAASVMLRAFLTMLERDRGYDPQDLVALNVSLPFADDSYRQTSRRSQAFDEILEAVATVPGVRDVGATTGFPGSALGILGAAPLRPPGAKGQLVAALHAATPAYFETMRIPIVAGRTFSRADSADGPPVAIVNEQLAREFPDGNPVGHRIPVAFFGGEPLSYEIVGVARNIRLSQQAGHRVFVPLAQMSAYWVDVVIRSDGRASVLSDVRRSLRQMNPNLLIENGSSFQTIISNSLALERAQSGFAVMLGSLAVAVAGVGLYALMTFLAAQRRREFGIRLALGSVPRRLFREAMTSALRLVGIGVAMGLIAAALLTRTLSSRVFGLTSADPAAFAGAATVVLVVAVIAVWVPAVRVMRTDPLVALRTD